VGNKFGRRAAPSTTSHNNLPTAIGSGMNAQHNGQPQAVGYSQYIKDTNILQHQQEFTENDKTSKEPFTDVFDRGYQLTLFAFQHGKQECLEPHFVAS
jgi:hypothetical protein